MAFIDDEGYTSLGAKALYIFILQKSMLAICLLLLDVALIIAQFLSIHSTTPHLSEWLNVGVGLVLFLFLVVALITILVAYVDYYSVRYKVAENDFSMIRGIISKQEISLPFHQIENVDIEQSPVYRLLRVCDLIILTAGHEDIGHTDKNESEIVLSGLEIDVAKDLQKRLLERANIQEVLQVKAPEDYGVNKVQG